LKNEGLDIVEGLARSETKEEATSSPRVRIIRALTILGTFGHTNRIIMVVIFDRLAPLEVTVRDEGPQGGSSGSRWTVDAAGGRVTGKKVIPIADIADTVVGKEEMEVYL
jgi:hypothetical protein